MILAQQCLCGLCEIGHAERAGVFMGGIISKAKKGVLHSPSHHQAVRKCRCHILCIAFDKSTLKKSL